MGFLSFFWPRHVACGSLVPQAGIEPWPWAVAARSPNHWTAREVPKMCFLFGKGLSLELIGTHVLQEWVELSLALRRADRTHRTL